MRLTWFYDLNHGFDKLTLLAFLGFFFNLFIFNFIFQYWVDWKLGFIIFFNLFSIGLSWSHNPDHIFDMLTRVNPSQSNMLLS